MLRAFDDARAGYEKQRPASTHGNGAHIEFECWEHTEDLWERGRPVCNRSPQAAQERARRPARRPRPQGYWTCVASLAERSAAWCCCRCLRLA